MYIRNPGHMTKMAAMPIYGKNPSKIFFSQTSGPISTKLGMKHQWLKHYNVNIRAVAGQRARLLLTFVKHKAKPDQ